MVTPLPNTFTLLHDLAAEGPHPLYQKALMTFGRFVGVWDMDVRFYDEAAKLVFRGPGVWSFAWVLDGRAIQDVLVYAATDDQSKTGVGERRIGTTLRFYQPEEDTWRVVWLGAQSGILVTLTGGAREGGLRLEGEEAPGVMLRWSFANIAENSFHWTGLVSKDHGSTWQLEQEMWARRRPS